jgi:hypothetical protein
VNDNVIGRGTVGRHPRTEDLAAFLDGRLGAPQSGVIVSHVASCPECYEVLSEAIRFVDEESAEATLDGEEEEGLSRPRRTWRVIRGPFAWRVGLATLAAAALVVLVVRPWQDGGGSMALPALYEPLSQDAAASRAVLAGIDQHGWPETLGAQPVGTARSSAFRLGVRFVEMEAALRSGDVETATRLARRIEGEGRSDEVRAALTAYFSGSSGIAARLEQGASPSSLLPLLHEADSLIVEVEDGVSLVDPLSYRLGQWAIAGQIAAETGQDAFFDSPLHESFFAELRRTDLPEVWSAPLARIERSLERNPRSRSELASAFRDLVAAGGEA